MARHFTATAYIINNNGQALLVNHKKSRKWLPIGGHIETNELPDEALIREIKEETGLDVEIISKKHPDNDSDVKMLAQPHHVQLEKIEDEHYHIDLVYVCKIKGSANLKGSEECRWFSKEELKTLTNPNVRYFATKIIDEME